MNWFDWSILIIWVLSIVGIISQIDEPREPVTKDRAIGMIVMMLLMITGLLWSHGVFN